MPQNHIAENAIPTAAGTAVVYEGVKALENENSFFNSSVEQILAGNFEWYGSDINTIIVSIFLVLNVMIAFKRWLHEKKKRNELDNCESN